MANGQTKRCTRCGEEKRLSAFGARGDGHQPWCRECRKAWDRGHYHADPARREAIATRRRANKARNVEANRAFLLEHFRSHPCFDCGETDVAVLEFDHVRGEKERGVSSMLEMSPPRVRAEVDKCDVRCGNCHRRKTAIEGNWWIHQAVMRLRAAGRLPS